MVKHIGQDVLDSTTYSISNKTFHRCHGTYGVTHLVALLLMCREVLKRAALAAATPAPIVTLNNLSGMGNGPAAVPVSPTGSHARTTSIILQVVYVYYICDHKEGR